MKTILSVLAALFIYDVLRFIWIFLNRFIRAYRHQKQANETQAKYDSLPFIERLKIKNLIKAKKKQGMPKMDKVPAVPKKKVLKKA